MNDGTGLTFIAYVSAPALPATQNLVARLWGIVSSVKLDQLHAKNDAMHTIVALLLGWESRKNPLVLKSLKMLAAGDMPEIVPHMSVLPAGTTPDQRAHI